MGRKIAMKAKLGKVAGIDPPVQGKGNAAMTENETPEESGSAPSPRARPAIVIVVLSALVGILLVVGTVGFFVAYRSDRKLENELASVKEEIRIKSQAHDDMKEQYEALSRQMAVLKEYAIARSGAASDEGKKEKGEPVPPGQAKQPVPGEVPPSSARPEAPAGVVKPPAAGQPSPAAAKEPAAKTSRVNANRRKTEEEKALSCDLLGKSLKEQEETLKRCVGVMDGASVAPRAR